MVQVQVLGKSVVWLHIWKKDSIHIWFHLSWFALPESEVTMQLMQKQLHRSIEFDVLGLEENCLVYCDQLSIIMNLIINGVYFYILIFSSLEDSRV